MYIENFAIKCDDEYGHGLHIVIEVVVAIATQRHLHIATIVELNESVLAGLALQFNRATISS